MQISVDNFALFADFLQFDPNMVYRILITTRNKDNGGEAPELKNRMPLFVSSRNELLARRDEIVQLCAVYSARAYIHVSPRRLSDMALQVNMRAAQILTMKDAKIGVMQGITQWAFGNSPNVASPKFMVVDYDDNDEYTVDDVIAALQAYRGYKGELCRIHLRYRTNAGYHLVADVFDTALLEQFPRLGCNRDGELLLLCPKF